MCLGLIGGAWIYGKVDEMGEFTGHNVAYVNQDLKTLYVGTFENGLMVGKKYIVSYNYQIDKIRSKYYISKMLYM